ncbi:HdeD family acid-resistance protein [Paraburkholderia bonniea]|uniref:HdeD family acid-resistance protein n=1 Tax=Paraburkholderia bonniea TaxID=2152891 RepID=UPI001C2BF6DC|nr:HdeD family acid-resistance protein [Paraburkholderia bonniea]WJF90156.1 HdeD family acid-resistance protein [Paraburkholderia bonniea]WJF93470.1 HdeD family acid-resistance protein [Paraburkholderia bonniea]
MNRPMLSSFPPSLNALTAHWGWLAVRGLAAIVFGVLAFTWPGLTLATLALFWGAYAIIDGAFALIYGVRGSGGTRRWTYAVVGVLGVLAGLIALFWPGETALILVMIIGAWALAIGVFEIVYAIQYRRANAHPWVIGLSGLLSAVVGFFILMYPGAGALSLIWLIGAYAIFYGVLLIFAAVQLRRFRHRAALN